MTDRHKPVQGEHEIDDDGEVKLGWRHGARRRILQSTFVLPSFVTVLNGLAGLGAIHYATKTALGEMAPDVIDNLRIAVWMLALAMVFDMLDGSLARITRRTSDFGGQLDSLCDAVSFGVAPPILMTRAAVLTIRQLGLSSHLQLERVVWAVGAVYLACTVMRLARFNVENEPDESAHMNFHGLPSPGAAGVVASLVLLFTRLTVLVPAWAETTWLLIAVSVTLPVMTLVAALLMVSNIQYAHLVNHWIRGRKPMSYVLKLVIIVLASLYEFAIAAAVFANIYALSGPVLSGLRRIRSRADQDAPDPDAQAGADEPPQANEGQ